MWNLSRNIILFLFFSQPCFGQSAWTWTPLADVPVRLSNNAVADGEISGNKYVFTFGGIDSTKIWSGINKKAFRYDVNNDLWEQIDTLPLDLPLIASAASTVQNKIYIIGGYHVYSNGNEVSSNKVIVYDPQTDSYLSNGADIPFPIDDQAQCVYKDSLIYVISGWSNSGNTFAVQIYDPSLDQWSAGTQVPNTQDYKVFGSSAYIIGDTIFYYGGASMGSNFPAKNKLRKGLIDPIDPTQITWSLEVDAPNTNYRSACISYGDNVFWVGGSSISYNYDGIAYNGSGGVSPSSTIARFDAQDKLWYEGTGAPYGVMDLRGAGQISPTEWIICGGMISGQEVSKSTFKLTYDPVTGNFEELANNKPTFYLQDHSLIFDQEVSGIKILSPEGKVVEEVKGQTIGHLDAGIYILEYTFEGSVFRDQFFLNNF
ncbi:MAG: hypothetical protein R2780_05395 [Crocinitomicaceae bacterium]|nr:hypothetical protein [Crocinitomicaceae bacterium]